MWLIRFIKVAIFWGKSEKFAAFPYQVVMRPMGKGYNWDTQDRERDLAKMH